MLELRNIKKLYPAGQDFVEALKGIDLQFRKSEFVSILGPSGCGKTTMLNIIGGLDQYTEGDLIINGVSTKHYKSRDWDTYRNHSIGFVFQSYNLIPHQSVLQNVELALTLSGVSKKERRIRATKALEQVGLGDQLKKRPGEMSGGQMQRVAIARALVNNPDIILADEPTGALDTETSVQVMEILKEVSKDRLVIMVTHNPDLAEQYSTRIIRMLDGRITGDSNPLSKEEVELLVPMDAPVKVKKPSMSLWTAFGLSLKNLFTKKGRTMLTSFAGSIGIIGIALILAVSTGMQTFINTVQEETLSTYPITLQSQHVDLASLLQAFSGAAKGKHDHDLNAIYQKSIIMDLVNALSSTEIQENDLASFKVFLEEKMKEDKNVQNAINGIQYTYDLDLSVYTKNEAGQLIHSDSQELMEKMLMQYMGATMGNMMGSNSSQQGNNATSGSMNMMNPMGMMNSTGMWQEMLSGNDGAPINDMIYKQYDLVYGSWPNSYNEIILVVDKHNELDDLTLYALGLKTQEDIDKIMDAAINKTELKEELQSWSYEEICAREYKVILDSDCYVYSSKLDRWTDVRESEDTTLLENVFESDAIPLKVTGIIRPKEDATAHMLKGSIAYTKMLTQHVIEKAQSSDVVLAQLANPDKDVITGLPFKGTGSSLTNQVKALKFKEYVAKLTPAQKADLYTKIMSIPSGEELASRVSAFVASIGEDRASVEAFVKTTLEQQYGVDLDLSRQSDASLRALFMKIAEAAVVMQYAEEKAPELAQMPAEDKIQQLESIIPLLPEETLASFFDLFSQFSPSTYEENLVSFGCLDLETPSGIHLFASSFENKENIESIIAQYNKDKDEVSKIAYTDYVGILMSSVTTIVDAIAYVLIAFVSISLIVSSIMIGVITLISVQERTKEIGILRAIGASKRDVSSMFNAETIIIGFASGVLGVGITYLLCLPINAIIQGLTGIGNLAAILPIEAAAILIGISVLLTLFAGFIPSRSAAKKDPVVALRTE